MSYRHKERKDSHLVSLQNLSSWFSWQGIVEKKESHVEDAAQFESVNMPAKKKKKKTVEKNLDSAE